MSSQQQADYRPHAVFLVVASAGVLLCLAAVLQVVVWELFALYRSRGLGLPTPSREFFHLFGHRPDAYLTAVIFWLWWPMVGALVFCHFRHRPPQAFATAFLYWFACCWMLAALALAFVAALCVYPLLTLLLANLEGPPKSMWVVTAVSWLLPLVALAFMVVCSLLFRERPTEEQDAQAQPVPGADQG